MHLPNLIISFFLLTVVLARALQPRGNILSLSKPPRRAYVCLTQHAVLPENIGQSCWQYFLYWSKNGTTVDPLQKDWVKEASKFTKNCKSLQQGDTVCSRGVLRFVGDADKTLKMAGDWDFELAEKEEVEKMDDTARPNAPDDPPKEEKKEEPPKEGEKKEEPPKPEGENKVEPPKEGDKKEEPPKEGDKPQEPPKEGGTTEEPPKEDGEKEAPPSPDVVAKEAGQSTGAGEEGSGPEPPKPEEAKSDDQKPAEDPKPEEQKQDDPESGMPKLPEPPKPEHSDVTVAGSDELEDDDEECEE
ncbi:hypothetical protein BJ508DRAFT_328708 [Ascobolus immersus RN42]|uniref:LysM domain-containing protein n=1 Tax=Ascobolus immersus RN42 TaxID=1160509 RepID=A0A3N4HZ86_ASCIM|nr:hypothetical protein BJ508DRAFT_328708 [Ascobolus immersus RN42]